MNAKVVLFFNQGRWGWTETYYWTLVGSTLDIAMADAVVLYSARKAMLSSGVTLEAVRVANQAVSGSSLLTFPAISNVASAPGGIQEPWEALLVNVQAVGLPQVTYRRKIMLRGLPIGWNTWTNAAPLGPPTNGLAVAALTRFYTILTNRGNQSEGFWAIRASSKNATVAARVPITQVGLVQPGGYFVVTPAPSATVWTLGQKVHVGKASGPGTRGLNADAYVTGVNAGVLTLSSRQTCPTTFIGLQGPAVIYPRNYEYLPIILAESERFVKRDTGRAFFGTLGHQKVKRC